MQFVQRVYVFARDVAKFMVGKRIDKSIHLSPIYLKFADGLYGAGDGGKSIPVGDIRISAIEIMIGGSNETVDFIACETTAQLVIVC